jgi:hypothetical protein
VSRNTRDRSTRLNAIVHTYLRRIRPRAQSELDWFAHQPSLHAAIRTAALAVNSCGKRYSHQRRRTKLALERARGALSKRARAMEKADDFSELFDLIDATLEPIPGLGELYVYDTALRIGAKLNLFPDKVYLHAGTRIGARALGLRAAATLDMSELPREFRALKPHEIEDVLCIFKDEFAPSRRIPVPADAVRRSWLRVALSGS